MTTETKQEELKQLLEDKTYTTFPQIGEVVHGTVISVGRNEIRVDLNGLAMGIVRGPELDPNLLLSVGDEIDATVVDLDNEFGELELSLKGAGRKKTWEKLKELFTSGTIIPVRILEANK
ncbi:S1 RNA-binding domain-containing protein, partial [Candidatus Uhrbacteria bacterium]|nr:S1 RNA-binding domain-containing protein [Candidatus Uhrbacteria bacterium]